MSQPYNGMPAGQLTDVTWRKSLLSNPSGNCVEMAALPNNGGFAVRNSRILKVRRWSTPARRSSWAHAKAISTP